MKHGCILTDSFIAAFGAKNYDNAVAILKQCTDAQQADMLQSLAELQVKPNKAVTDPSVIVVIKRKLQPGKTMEDFHQARQPPVPCERYDGHHRHYDYFKLPARVINAYHFQDSNQIISVGMMHGESEAQFITEMQQRAESEKQRAEKLNSVIDGRGETEIYIVHSDDILGK
jgi:hypothetical protein